MRKFMKRAIALMLSLVMVSSVCSTAFALDNKTEQYMRKAAAAGISKASGMIPVVGDVISNVIDTFLPDMLGVEDDDNKVMAKLDEISESIDKLNLQISENQQQMFHEFYSQKISNFNIDANKLKTTINLLYDNIMSIEKKYGSSNRDEKQIMLARLIESNGIGETGSAISQLINLTDYLCGTQLSMDKEDGIFQLVYKANCKDSVLGSEAAIKSSAYVNQLSQYMETAYKTIFVIYAAKIYVCENIDEIKAKIDDGAIGYCNLSNYSPLDIEPIKTSVFSDKNSSLLTYYNKLFDENRKDSAINVYNDMIADVWFSYIDNTDYTLKPAKISYIALDPEIGFAAPDNISYTNPAGAEVNYVYGATTVSSLKKLTSDERYSVVNKACNIVDTEMLNAANAALSPKQIDRLVKHMAHNPAFGTDKNELSMISVLEDLGFSFAEYNAYVDDLPKTGIGQSYRDPDLPKAQTDGKYKVMPTSVKHYSDDKNKVVDGWMSDCVNGYGLQESLNAAEVSTCAEMVRICFDSKNSTDKLGDYLFSNVMLLYFVKPEGSLAASFFSSLSSATVPIICVGAALMIAVPTVIILAKRKKKKAAAAIEEK